MKRIIVMIAAVIIIAATAFFAIQASYAETSACHTGTFGSYCNTVESGNKLAMDNFRQGGFDNVLVAWDNNSGDAGTDFSILQAVKGGVEFLYTPNGVFSGLCASDPGGGYPQDPTYPDGIILRTCNGSNFQRWTSTSTCCTSAVLTNAATGLVLTDNGFDKQLSDAAPITASLSQQWTLAA